MPLLSATTPVVEGYVVTLLPETPGTRVPVQIPDGYPGTKIPESPSTSPQYLLQLSWETINSRNPQHDERKTASVYQFWQMV